MLEMLLLPASPNCVPAHLLQIPFRSSVLTIHLLQVLFLLHRLS